MSYVNLDWWEIYFDGKILSTVRGKERAEWFLKELDRSHPLSHWEIMPARLNNLKPITPEEVLMTREVSYCVGSD